MKTLRPHIVLWLAGLTFLAGAGCAVEVPETKVSETAVTFDPVLYAVTKASAGVFPEGLPFGVSAWEYGDGETWSGEEARPFLVNSEVIRREDAVWSPQPEVQWPERHQRLAFVAYAPYGMANGVDPVNGVTFGQVDVTRDQTDLLYTDPAEDLTESSSGGIVSLAFRHALCQVSFRLRYSEMEDETITLLGLSLKDLGCTGTFRSLPTAGWTVDESHGELTFYEGNQKMSVNSEPVGECLWVIPQNAVTRAQIRVLHQYSKGGSAEETLTSDALGIPLEPGRSYIISLTYMPQTGTLKVDQLEDLQG